MQRTLRSFIKNARALGSFEKNACPTLASLYLKEAEKFRKHIFFFFKFTVYSAQGMEGYVTNFICDFLGVLNNSKEHIPPKADKKIFTSEIFQNFDFLQ